jgi:hypothetical protein
MPENLLQLVSRSSLRQPNGESACYDLDLYFHMTTSRSGQKVALVYKPCVENRPQSREMGRDAVLARLVKLRVEVVERSGEDFRNLAANGISPENGKILFPAPVSESLKWELAAHGIETLQPEKPLGNFGHPALAVLGLHCFTADVIQLQESQGDEAPGHHAEL